MQVLAATQTLYSDEKFAAWAKAKANTPARWAASHRVAQSCTDTGTTAGVGDDECAFAVRQTVATPTSVVTGLTVIVNGSGDPPLKVDSDESYAMTITPTGATIEATTQWGAIRALETFAQTVYCLPSASAAVAARAGAIATAPCVYTIRNLPLTINDSPRFKWRGVMIDTARHFIGTPSLKRVIDGMSMNKMNMLHWHATDDTSWSIESAQYPNFTKLGAYSQKQFYSVATIADLKKYAEERGVILYPEFDLPGHAQIWSHTYPEYTDPTCNGIDVTGLPGHDIYQVLTNLATELGGDAIHFGGDEFNSGSWCVCDV